MFNKSLLVAYGAPAAVVKSAMQAHSEFTKVEKLNIQKFEASIKAGQGLSELRFWFDVAKKEKRTDESSGAPLPNWYEFVEQVTGIGRSWGAYLLQATNLIDGGASTSDYLEAEEFGRADIKRFIRWAKDGTLESPKDATEDETEDETPKGNIFISVRSEGAVIDIYEDGRVEVKGPNVAKVLDTLFAAVAESGIV